MVKVGLLRGGGLFCSSDTIALISKSTPQLAELYKTESREDISSIVVLAVIMMRLVSFFTLLVISGCNQFQIREVGGFLKLVKVDTTAPIVRHLAGDRQLEYKCLSSNTTYRYTISPLSRSYSINNACQNDTMFYQACGTYFSLNTLSEYDEEEDNGLSLCGGYVCEPSPGTTILQGLVAETYVKEAGWLCDGVRQCSNTDHDEAGCRNYSNIVKLPSGAEGREYFLCDGVYMGYMGNIFNVHADLLPVAYSGEDEGFCNGLVYGMYCNDTFYVDTVIYVSPQDLCNGKIDCLGGVDENNCEVKDNMASCIGFNYRSTSYRNVSIPLYNYTRCSAMQLVHVDQNSLIFSSYRISVVCKYSNLDQTNCTDPERVGLKCKVNGYMTSVSKYQVCSILRSVCDDGLDLDCLAPSPKCYLHKHRLCDGVDDCSDGSDEKDTICRSLVNPGCHRKGGNDTSIHLPSTWISDGIEDCVDGQDEDKQYMWPKCNFGDKEIIKTEGLQCNNVFICQNEAPGYVQLHNLCDGLEHCGNDRQICKISYEDKSLHKTVLLSAHHKIIHLGYCIPGIATFSDSCLREVFQYPSHSIFGLEATHLHIPQASTSCDHLYGENYVYFSCTGKCPGIECPLKTPPKLGHCPGSRINYVGTLGDNKYVALLKRSYYDVYINDFFVCDNGLECISYQNVCDLVEDCKDGSDEARCSNSYECKNGTGRIPKSKVCDGSLDCLDFSDECNDRCSKRILSQAILRPVSWIIGILAVIFNFIIIFKVSLELYRTKSVVQFTTKSLVLLISFGDFLVGCYLFSISIVDEVVYNDNYCMEQAGWLTSDYCSVLGVVSTIGIHLSLFSMTELSVFRAVGISSISTGPRDMERRDYIKRGLNAILITLLTAIMSIIPLLKYWEDFFVNGLSYSSELKVFIGFPDKKVHHGVLEAYYGRMGDTQLKWDTIRAMVYDMFSHDYYDYLSETKTLGFYGNHGVCLFKYFVSQTDPQKLYAWSVLAIDFICFVFISASYIKISITAIKSANKVQAMNAIADKALSKRTKTLNRKITAIISSNFICWIPFMTVCILHSLELVDATPWYSLFSNFILPLNTVINPLLYDDFVTTRLMTCFGTNYNQHKTLFLGSG